MAKPAARLSDPTSCPVPGHGTNPITAGSPNVLFDGLPAARQGDPSGCGGPLVSGLSATVFINGLPAATVGSNGAHGNVVISGSGTVIIGDNFTPLPARLHRFILRSRLPEHSLLLTVKPGNHWPIGYRRHQQTLSFHCTSCSDPRRAPSLSCRRTPNDRHLLQNYG